MDRIRRLASRIRQIRPRTIFLTLGGVFVLLILFISGLYAWDYTNSSYFCGTTCHTMPPHYESYLRSPHARVQCVECHIGRTFLGVQITRKAVDAQFVWAYATGQYEYPIQVKNLQPARESCEKCHWPEKFAWDKVIKLAEFSTDDANSPLDTTLIMKIGGGTAREGLGRGIHWHIENPIDFIYTDDLQQQIPYIEVTNADGTKTAYSDLENPLTPAQIASMPRRRMDCIDCHNRVSHRFQLPAEALDSALATKQIDPAIPAIKEKGIEVLTPKYADMQIAQAAINRLDAFYSQNFADYYQKNQPIVQNAINVLQTLYPQLHYPDQGLDWTTHPDNIGHKNWPGCFRCHDGKHFTSDRKEAIRLECNVCHSLPTITTQGQAPAAIALERVDEPASHRTTTWLLEHRTKFDASCQGCHDTRNAGGKDNSSFCSNSACHGTEWKFAGFDAPALAQIIKPPVAPPSDPNAPPPQIPHPIGGNPDCQICHGLTSTVRPMPADHEGRTNDLCLACHKSTIPLEGQTTEAGKPPPIPHDLTGRAECLGCHGSGLASMPQIPESHKEQNFNSGQCTTCHQPAKAGELLPTSAPTSGAPSQTTPAPVESTATPEASPAPSNGPPNIPPNHATSACTACHATGAAGAPKFPDNHAAFKDEMCTTCHQPAGAAQATTVPVPTQGVEATTTSSPSSSEIITATVQATGAPLVSETITATVGTSATVTVEATNAATTTVTSATPAPSGGPPNIPPDHATQACAACHATGLAGAPKFPGNHTAFKDDQCTMCHQPASAGSVAPTAATSSGVAVTPTVTTAAPAASGAIPKIPHEHSTAGCTVCHSAGLRNTPIFPDNHVAFKDDQCETCHQVQE